MLSLSITYNKYKYHNISVNSMSAINETETKNGNTKADREASQLRVHLIHFKEHALLAMCVCIYIHMCVCVCVFVFVYVSLGLILAA